MKKLKIVLYVVGFIQIVLGIMALFFPSFFIETVMELSSINNDTAYPMAMFASRLLVFGVGMFIVAKNPIKHVLLINGMIAIQLLDLAGGIFHVLAGTVLFSSAIVAMFNAT
jgi:hypothetical protein